MAWSPTLLGQNGYNQYNQYDVPPAMYQWQQMQQMQQYSPITTLNNINQNNLPDQPQWHMSQDTYNQVMTNNPSTDTVNDNINWSKIGGAVKGGMNLATAVLQDITDILGSTKSQINDKPSYDFSQTNTFDDLSHNNLHLASTDQLTRPTFGSSFMDINMRTARGAIAGLSLGPWGALGGAIGGTLSGVANSITKANRYNKDVAKINRLNTQAMQNYNNDFTQAFNDINNKNIDMTNLSRSRNTFAEGGGIHTTINTGGTHEENPFGGVQLGVDAQGTPNLVEEGEVVYNDYVFSNRIKPDNQFLKQFNSLFKQTFNSYADAANFILNLNKERQNDYWTKQTQNKMMQNLASAQELQKMSMEAAANGMTVEEYLTYKQLQEQERQSQIANGENSNEDPYLTNAYQSQQQQIQQLQNPMMAFGGNLFATGGPIDPPKTPNYNIGRTILNANIPQTLTLEDFQKARKDWAEWLKTDEGLEYWRRHSQVYGEQPLQSVSLATLFTPVGDIEDIAYIIHAIKNRDWKSVAQGTMLAAIPGAWASRGYRNANKIAHQASNSKHLYNQSGRNATDQFHRTPAGSSSAVQRGAREQQPLNFEYTLDNPVTGQQSQLTYFREPVQRYQPAKINVHDEATIINRMVDAKRTKAKSNAPTTTPQSNVAHSSTERSTKTTTTSMWAQPIKVWNQMRHQNHPIRSRIFDFLLGSVGLYGIGQGVSTIVENQQQKNANNEPLTAEEIQMVNQAKAIITDTNNIYTLEQKEIALGVVEQYQDRPGFQPFEPSVVIDTISQLIVDADSTGQTTLNDAKQLVQTIQQNPTVLQADSTINITNPKTQQAFKNLLSKTSTTKYWSPTQGTYVNYDVNDNTLIPIDTSKSGRGYDGIIDETNNTGWQNLLNSFSPEEWSTLKQTIAQEMGKTPEQIESGLTDGKFGPIHKRVSSYYQNNKQPKEVTEQSTEQSTEPENAIVKPKAGDVQSSEISEYQPINSNKTLTPFDAFVGTNNPLRYAPVFDNIRSIIEQNNPDYTYANQLASLYQPLDYNPTGERMQYTPVDQYYLANQAEIARNTQMGAYRNNANTNQGNAYMNSMINQQTNNLIGDSYIKALQQNEQMRNQALQYNNQLDAQNEANRLNVQAQNASNYAQIMGNSYRAAEEERLAIENAREANRQNLATNLGLIGKEQSDYFNINHNPALSYGAFGTFYKGLTPEQQKSFDNIWNTTFKN